MKHTYSPEEYLTLEKLQQELKDIEIEAKVLENRNPKKATVRFILDYSKAYEHKPLKNGHSFEQLLN